MSKKLTIDEMKQHINSVLPSDAVLVDFLYDTEHFGNTVVKINQNKKLHIFVTDRGEIYHNNTMLCDSSYQYKEKEDTFPKLLQTIKIKLEM